MSNRRPQKDQAPISTALAAVAIQDHIVRNLRLDRAQPWNERARVSRNTRHVSQNSVSQKSSGYGVRKRAKVSSNEGGVTDSEAEYVLDKSGPPPSLAEKLGLIEITGGRLSEKEWIVVKSRANHRHDFQLPCVICKEELGISEQVLLSCSHVFHKNCLSAFERFVMRKTCPMCRREQYQTRVVYDGKTFYRNKCATVIQATWRGYMARRMYREIRKHHPPNDARLRRQYYEEKLRSITDRMIDTHARDVDSLISELNRDLEVSRKMLSKYDDVTREISELQWKEIITQGLGRDCHECSICLMPLRGRYLPQKGNLQPVKEQDLDDICIVPNSVNPMATSLTASEIVNSSFKPTSTNSIGSNVSLQRVGKEWAYNGKQTSNGKLISTYNTNNKGVKGGTSNGFIEPMRKSNVYGRSVTRNANIVSQVSNKERADASKVQNGRRVQKVEGSVLTKNGLSTVTKAFNKKPRQEKEVAVLSCTHAFHNVCLQALEEFASEESRFVCPICRSPYQKRVIDAQECNLTSE